MLYSSLSVFQDILMQLVFLLFYLEVNPVGLHILVCTLKNQAFRRFANGGTSRFICLK